MLNDGDHRDVRLRWTRIISPNVLPVTTPGVFRPVKMHSVFEIDIIVRREALNTMLSIGVPLTLLKTVHFYSRSATKFSTRGGCMINDGHRAFW